MSKMEPWIGVDLDGTLAVYDKWRGHEHVGDPVPEMLARVKAWIADGHVVKIFTARATDFVARDHINTWLDKHGLSGLEITNVKDYGMVELWDDRCVGVEPNTGRPLNPSRRGLA